MFLMLPVRRAARLESLLSPCAVMVFIACNLRDLLARVAVCIQCILRRTLQTIRAHFAPVSRMPAAWQSLATVMIAQVVGGDAAGRLARNRLTA